MKEKTVFILSQIGGGKYSKLVYSYTGEAVIDKMDGDTPHPLHLTIKLRHPQPKRLWGILKEELTNRGKLVRGDWFSLDEEDINWIVERWEMWLIYYKTPPSQPSITQTIVSLQKQIIQERGRILQLVEILTQTNLKYKNKLREAVERGRR